jgi:CopA family copper-resistance protein
MNHPIERRALLRTGAYGAAGFSLAGLLPAWAQSNTLGIRATLPTLTGEDIHLKIARSRYMVGGRAGNAITLNGVLPAPLIRLKEGQNVRLHVENSLDEDSSIHWHGLILPFQMDGVPGVSFPGIKPHSIFTYQFPVKQNGTYWYHSHSGLQEQLGHYGPIVIDPAGVDPVGYDREHVIVLSDWSFLDPHRLFTRLKQEGGYFNRQKQTLAGMIAGGPEEKLSPSERAKWGKMRMDPADIADVSATTYTYLINGHGPQENWTGLFRPGERVRLRVINASSMSIFNIRIPGLRLSVVQSDGQNVRPVTVDEFQIGTAETYDVVVQPNDDRAYTIVAESLDRSGMGCATLAPRPGMAATVPPLRERPTLTMKDMGMGGMDHGAHGAAAGAATGAMDHGAMSMRDKSKVPESVSVGVGMDAIAFSPVDRTGDPGVGLDNVGHKVLTYRDLVALEPNPDPRPPARTIEVHLTGNMERFMWSFDGKKFSDGVEPIRFERNERARVVLVNHTMMTHPIHLHGHFFEVVNGQKGRQPLKHTINVLPGGKASFDLTADAPGDWAFHCHLLLHMHAGMFRVVTVRPYEGEDA